MKNFIINDEIFNLYPDLQIGVVICKDINNTISQEAATLLKESIENSFEKLSKLSNLTDLSIVKDWRNAYKKFNEKKNRSSIESLLRRIYNNKPVSSINPLVDIYNAISIKYELPCGGEDIDKFSEIVELTLSNGTESFLPLSSEEPENPNVNEVIYKTGQTVICRCFNWRESIITELTNETKNAFLCIECLNASEIEKLKLALDDLGKYTATYLDGTYKIYLLNKNNKSITF